MDPCSYKDGSQLHVFSQGLEMTENENGFFVSWEQFGTQWFKSIMSIFSAGNHNEYLPLTDYGEWFHP